MKMTTLHHYRCPLTAELGRQTDIAFAGILVDGVSELCDDKIFTAKRTAQLAAMMQADGAIVTVDGFGNHHVDFVNVIEQLGRHGIPAVGVSFFGEQGKLVCTGDYLDCLLDINKTSSGVETCVVGQNNLTADDAYKAVRLLKYRMRKAGKTAPPKQAERAFTGTTLMRRSFPVHEVRFGRKTQFQHGVLEIMENIRDRALGMSPDIRDIQVRILAPGENDLFVNANLDFFPIACKVSGELGVGITHLLTGMTVMLTGVEEGGFQPANIGSSYGILRDHLVKDQAGTPASGDYLLHVDVLLRDGAGRTAVGILAAHQAADRIADEIREPLLQLHAGEEPDAVTETFTDAVNPGLPRAVLVKIVSGLGSMYDTALFPAQPCGILGARLIRQCGCIPWAITPNQCRDGVIHSLI
ncbi:MAG: glycine/sarcosine/betaine reductase component B subunit [Lachnospiraceae bacterium]